MQPVPRWRGIQKPFILQRNCYGEKNSALSHYRKMGACPITRIFLEQ